MDQASDITAHYRHGGLEAALLAGVVAAGKDPAHLAHGDLAGADEFHIGGAAATAALIGQLGLAERAAATPAAVLDLGSGIGGPARHMAAAFDCRVTGVELSGEFVQVARSLSRRMGLAERVTFHEGSATELPFADASFDAATLIHVGMNIADKAALCAAVRRVLRPGGRFAVYDIMRLSEGELVFPLPWAGAPAQSFLAGPAAYRAALEGAGFRLISERNRLQFAREFFAALRARVAQGGPPPLGVHIVMGASAPAKIGNMVGLLEQGVIGPVEIIAQV